MVYKKSTGLNDTTVVRSNILRNTDNRMYVSTAAGIRAINTDGSYSTLANTGGVNPMFLTIPIIVISTQREQVQSSFAQHSGQKVYELKDLPIAIGMGNFRAVVTDRKFLALTGSNPKYKAELASVTDYYAYGSPLYGRTYTSAAGSYRYGFNTQEKVDEISGEGNHNTAEFWEYDTRLGRRWNVDPMAEDYPWQSPYCVFNNNPVSFIDEDGLEGDDPNPVIGKNEKTGKDIREKTDVSKLKLNLRAKVINIMVIGTGANPNDIDPTVGWKPGDKIDKNAIALYVNNSADLDKMLTQIRTEYGKEIGNIIFVSHGNGFKCQFSIGASTIDEASDLDFLKDDLTENSMIMTTACHAGSPMIGGDQLLKAISMRFGVVAIGNQGWSGSSAGPDNDMTNTSTYGSKYSTNYNFASKNKDKWFTIAVPPKLAKSNTVTLYQGQDVRVSKSGVIYLKYNKIQKLKYDKKGKYIQGGQGK